MLLLEGGGPSTALTGGLAPTIWNATGASQDAEIFTSGQTHLCTDTARYTACLFGGGVEINTLVFVPPAAHDFDEVGQRAGNGLRSRA